MVFLFLENPNVPKIHLLSFNLASQLKASKMKQIILAIICLFLISPSGYCQDAKQPLLLTIKSDKQVYLAGEPIYVDYELKNISRKDIEILQPFSKSEIIDRPANFFIKEENWQERGKLLAAVDYYPGYGVFNIIRLAPEKSYRKKVNVVEFDYLKRQVSYTVPNVYSKSGNIPTPYVMANLPAGIYTITADYSLPKVFAEAQCGQKNCWQGTLSSNPITIEVKGKSQ